MHKVFVYGSLLSGMGNHRIIEGSKKLGDSYSPKGFGMVDLGSFPGAVVVPDSDSKIIGEVYEVDDTILQRLDRLEGYNSLSPERGLYDRITINTDFGMAYIYLINGKYKNESYLVKDGDWKTYYHKKHAF